jgi:DNA modification methylase
MTMATAQRIIPGDCIAGLRTLPDESVHCCVTSPPYWGLRDYGHDGQIGLEPTPEAYVARMVEVFREVRRVLRDDGTCWVNLGDSYAGSWGNQGRKETRGTQRPINGPMLQRLRAGKVHDDACCLDEDCLCPAGDGDDIYPDKQSGTGSWVNDHPTLKAKDLVGIPWRVAFALQADGWWLRQDIIWHKPNPMPESVRDRCTKAHEYVFLLTKSERYFYDAEAVSERSINDGKVVRLSEKSLSKAQATGRGVKPSGDALADSITVKPTRNRRSVWTITTKPYSGAHFAVMPADLVEPCIKAGCPDQCCTMCGAGYERVTARQKHFESGSGRSGNTIEGKQDLAAGETNSTPDIRMGPVVEVRTLGWQPACDCAASGTIPGTVLDPFAGSGTTLAVAAELGRNAVGCELNPEYVLLAQQRIKEARSGVSLFEGTVA